MISKQLLIHIPVLRPVEMANFVYAAKRAFSSRHIRFSVQRYSMFAKNLTFMLAIY